jgi:hypothetical protein
LGAGKKEEALSLAMQKKFCSGTGKAMHAMQYSNPDTYNTVQDLSCQMHKATQDHFKAMLHILKHILYTVEEGLVLKPNRKLGLQSKSQICYKWTLGLRLCQGA